MFCRGRYKNSGDWLIDWLIDSTKTWQCRWHFDGSAAFRDFLHKFIIPVDLIFNVCHSIYALILNVLQKYTVLLLNVAGHKYLTPDTYPPLLSGVVIDTVKSCCGHSMKFACSVTACSFPRADGYLWNNIILCQTVPRHFAALNCGIADSINSPSPTLVSMSNNNLTDVGQRYVHTCVVDCL